MGSAHGRILLVSVCAIGMFPFVWVYYDLFQRVRLTPPGPASATRPAVVSAAEREGSAAKQRPRKGPWARLCPTPQRRSQLS